MVERFYGGAETGLILRRAVAGRPMGTQLAKGQVAAEDSEARVAEAFGEGDEERAPAIGPGAVGEDEAGFRGCGGAMKKSANGRIGLRVVERGRWVGHREPPASGAIQNFTEQNAGEGHPGTKRAARYRALSARRAERSGRTTHPHRSAPLSSRSTCGGGSQVISGTCRTMSMGLWCRRGGSSIKLTFRGRDKPDGGGNRRGRH